ncbi:hypothetical protein QOZ80_3AG0224190 [Eleusine coracana subsp. coracana]|nr:hypothetical protein QOZ80_3AG0224190 [Eleusine coracana subsp. coracana]
MLGECSVEVLLIILDNSETMVCRVFCWMSGERKWVMITSLGGRTLFLGFHGFAACIGPDCPGIQGDYSGYLCSWTMPGECHEYSLADGTCNVRYAEYPGAPPLNNNSPVRPLVWIFPSLC